MSGVTVKQARDFAGERRRNHDFEPFVAAVADAQDTETFLRVFDRHLERVSI